MLYVILIYTGHVKMFLKYVVFFLIVIILSFEKGIYKQFTDIPIGANYAPLVADILFKYSKVLKLKT